MIKVALVLLQVVLAYLKLAKTKNKLSVYQEKELLKFNTQLANILRAKEGITNEVSELSDDEVAAALGIK